MKALKHGLIGWVCVLVLAACTEVLSLQRIQIEKAEQMLQQNAEEAIALLQSVKDPEVLPDSLRARFALAMGQAHYNAHWVMMKTLCYYTLWIIMEDRMWVTHCVCCVPTNWRRITSTIARDIKKPLR